MIIPPFAPVQTLSNLDQLEDMSPPYPPRPGPHTPPGSQWGSPGPRQDRRPEPEIHFYGAYLIVGLLLSIFLFFCLVRTFWRRQQEESFDPALDELDLDFEPRRDGDSLDADRPDMTDENDYYDPWWDEGPINDSLASTTTATMTGTGAGARGFQNHRDMPYSYQHRPRDDTYEAALASLISLEVQHESGRSSFPFPIPFTSSRSQSQSQNQSPSPYFLQYQVRDMRKFQRLVEKLRNASYSYPNPNPSASSNFENHPSGHTSSQSSATAAAAAAAAAERRREIEGLRMQIAELVVDVDSAEVRGRLAQGRRGGSGRGRGRANGRGRPRLHVYTEPPPAYHDVVSLAPVYEADRYYAPLPPPPASPPPLNLSLSPRHD